uniref:GDSL esterase/lipase n=1 Tax=Populus davidiana TaxID=266767 RepID=A0A6M2EED8_9ROSI
MRTSSNRQAILGIVSKTYDVCILLSLISLSSAEGTPALYIFGDSGVDVGNNLYINTLAKPVFPNGIDFGKPFGTPSGRYSNGRISVDFIAQELGLKNFPPPYLAPTTAGDVLLNGVNYASSGSGILNETGSFFGGVISLENQIRYFNRTRQDIISNIGIRDAKKLLAGAIYIVATGGNDVAQATPRRNSSSDGLASLDLRLDTILSTLRSQLIKLYKLGARKLVVVNSPPGGCLPFARDVLSKPDGCVPLENQIDQMYNPKLKSMLEELTKTLTGSQFVNADSYAIQEDIIQNYIQYGFQDVRNACCYVLGAHGGIVPCATISQVCGDRTSYVFWDPFHLTETANSIVAKHMLDGDLKYMQPMNIRKLSST